MTEKTKITLEALDLQDINQALDEANKSLRIAYVELGKATKAAMESMTLAVAALAVGAQQNASLRRLLDQALKTEIEQAEKERRPAIVVQREALMTGRRSKRMMKALRIEWEKNTLQAQIEQAEKEARDAHTQQS
jgi:hypothetical protein